MRQVRTLRVGSRLEDRPRYTPTSAFETSPSPSGLLTTKLPNAALGAEAQAARLLDAPRDNRLNPPQWTSSLAHEAELSRRTLTGLCNARPAYFS